MSDKRRVFIIEDDVDAFMILKKLLILSEYEVDGVTQSRDALKKIKEFNPDVILLDLLMPEIGGLEICEMLNKDVKTQTIPIIIVSALGGQTDIKKAYSLGVVSYFTKPYEYEDLVVEINKAIAYKTGEGL